MRIDDFWIESDSGLGPAGGLCLDLLERLRAGPIAEYTDLEAGIALARLLDEQFRRYGTDATNEIGNEESREALRTLRALTGRIGVPFDCGFRAKPITRFAPIRSVVSEFSITPVREVSAR